MMRKISAAIVTKDEERNIERCLKSLEWVDEIVVVDSGSTDRTLEICEKYGCRIVKTEWLGFGPTKQLAVDSVSNDWVLSIDADEEVTGELAREIQETLSGEEVKAGYKIRWLSMYLGKWIKRSGWNKQYKPKLFNTTKGRFTDAFVHETVKIDGEVGRLKHPLRHYTYPDLDTVRSKMESQANWGAQALDQKGIRPSRLNAYAHAGWTFVRTYVLSAGFLDGHIGLTLAKNRAYTVYLKYIRHWRKHRGGTEGL
ncbi:glycosyltransferase family 2 protein [Candidatus Eisenbacteria bacterium]|uniref:Glycosyltransferase family 2 protein n=1 Tax=Eiseniibacteriota bacterium TaxID=2212470 RepID=A0ABV6YNR5_UNCEI